MQYLVLQCAGIIGLLWLFPRKRSWLLLLAAVITGGFAWLNLEVVLPYYRVPSIIMAESSEPVVTFKIFHANVFEFNPDRKSIFGLIRKEKPDIVSLEELDAGWRKALHQSSILAAYPYRARYGQTYFLSRLPASAQILQTERGGYLDEFILAKVRINETLEPVTVVVTHTTVPTSRRGLRNQRRLFEGIVRYFRTHPDGRPMILAGDLNTTPWSANFQLLKSGLNLKEARIGYGLEPTWPFFIPPALIPIDHVLISPEFSVKSYRTGPFIGSDHLPIIVELQLINSPNLK